MKKRIGIIGGTFDPIHLGHLIIAENAYETFNLDEVCFVPAGVSHYKMKVTDPKIRIQMTGISIEDNAHFAMSTIEADNPNVTYTYETISKLTDSHPDYEYFLIVGADAFLNLENWVKPEEIFKRCSVLVAERIGTVNEDLDTKIEELKAKYGSDIFKLPITSVDISSSAIRERVRDGKSIRYMVHYKCIEFINKTGLYKEVE